MLKKIFKNIKFLFPEELFGFIILNFFLIVFILSKKIPSFKNLELRHIIFLISYVFILSILAGLKPFGIFRIFRIFFPAILLFAVFNNLGDIVSSLNPHKYDFLIINIENKILGTDLSLWMQKFYNPLLTNFMFFCYVTYFLLHTIVGLTLYFKRNLEAYKEFVTTLLFTAFSGYILYIIFPVVGPRFSLCKFYTKEFEILPILHKIVQLIDRLEPLKEDCFPSLHLSLSLVTIFFTYKYSKVLFWILLPIVIGLSVSTIYCRYHYLTDVIAGIIHATFFIFLGIKINSFWNKKILDKPVRSFYI